jgi:hypothetical protein
VEVVRAQQKSKGAEDAKSKPDDQSLTIKFTPKRDFWSVFVRQAPVLADAVPYTATDRWHQLCVCGYWKGTYAVLNTYGITIEFIDALAVSKSATGETVKIVDVEVYDDKERHVNSSLLSSVPYPTFRKDFDGLLVGLLADMNLMDTIVLPTGAKVPLPHTEAPFRVLWAAIKRTRKFNDDHED